MAAAVKHAQQRKSEPRRSASLTSALHINMHRRQAAPPPPSLSLAVNAGSSDSEDGEERSANAWTAGSSLLSSSHSSSLSATRSASTRAAPSSDPVRGRHAELTGQCPLCLTWRNIAHFAHANAWICGYIDDLGQVCGHTWMSNGMRATVCSDKTHESVLERHWGVYGFACTQCKKFAPLNPMEKKRHKKKNLKVSKKE
jgi:hypothetical protein